MKFKVGGLTPEEDARAVPDRARGRGARLRPLRGRQPGLDAAEAVRFARLVEDLDLHWFEEPCIWSNDRRAMRDVRYGGGVRVCAGQSEFSAGGCRDLMVDGAIDFCNFDSSWSGGATEWRRVAAAAALVRRGDGASRGAPDRVPSARLDPARHVPRGVQPRARPDLVEPRRQPAADRRREDDAPDRARPRLGARRRLHRGAPDPAPP